MVTQDGLKKITAYADGIGPWINQIAIENEQNYTLTKLVSWAHENNLDVHPYTVRADNLPTYANSMEDLLKILINEAKVDGIFTDFPDRAVNFLK